MSTIQDFEAALNEVVQAKRLSQSKMTKLTEVAMKLMDHDTQLVSTMYRTHKSLPASSKISSLYIFDALSRAARQQVVKHNLSERNGTGNCATFLLKVAGVLEGLFQDMLSSELPEAKDKTKKIYDIWVKGGTFPTSILDRLSDIVSGKEPRVNISDPHPTPQTNHTSLAQSPAAPAVTDSQATLLALLTQAAGQQITQTTANTVASPTTPAADPTHLLLQYLHSASVNSTSASQLSPTTPSLSDIPAISQTSPDPRIPKPPAAPHTKPVGGRQSPRHDNSRSPARNEHHRERGYDDRGYSRHDPGGNPRRRGRWNRWDEREPDHQRGSYSTGRNHLRGPSRSRSPEGRFHRRKSPEFSPSRREPISPGARRSGDSPAARTAEKDEFGRDLRSPSSSSKSPTSKAGTIVSSTTSPITPSTPHDPKAEFSPMSTSNDLMSRSSSIAANTFSEDHNVSNTSVESSTETTSQSGLDSFDMSTFDPTSPASWEALGRMWEAMNGYTPSMQELMQFMMMGALSHSFQSQNLQQQSTVGFNGTNGTDGYEGGYGRGVARGTGGNGGFYGNSRNNDREEVNGQSTDVAVRGSGGMDSEGSRKTPGGEQNQSLTSGVLPGGKMQKVGDRWVFVCNDGAA